MAGSISFKRVLATGAASLAMSLCAGVAHAQDAEEGASSSDEIVVTALRRSTVLQDTPISISALSGEMLEEMGATTLNDMATSVPGLNLTEGNTGQRRLTVRGVQSAGESTVGLYLGETPVTGPNSATSDPSSITPDLNMFDVERVEVLRGPQGTLFGSGSMSGTVRLLYNQADSGILEGGFESSVSSVNEGGVGYSVRGMINVPIVEDLFAARVVLYDEVRPGYVDNPRLGQEDINETRAYGGRLMLSFTPTDDLTITGMMNLQNQRADNSAVWYPDIGEYQADNYHNLPFPNEFRLYNLAAEWDLGFATLNGSTSYYDWNAVKYIDGARGALSSYNGATYCARYYAVASCSPAQVQGYRDWITSIMPLSGYQPMIVETWVHELRLASNGDGPFQWTIGAFLEDRQDASVSSTVEADPVTGDVYMPIVYNFSRSVAVDLTQTAFFGEVSYEIFDGLTVSAGARNYSYDKTVDAQVLMTSYINSSIAGPMMTYDASADGWVTKLNISYEVSPDIMVYAQRGEGFRPGGANNTPGLAPEYVPYSSDELVAYEVGVKTEWFDRALTVNVSAYELQWTDMQIAARIPNYNFIANVGGATIRGLELESIARPIDNLTLRGTMTFVDGTLDEDQVLGVISAPGRAGDRIPFEPEFRASFSADYEWPITALLDGVARVDYTYVGESFSEFRPTSTTYERMGDYSNVNLRGGVEGEDWGVHLFVQNLFDEIGHVRVTSGTLSERATLSTTPRTIGVSVNRSF